MELSSLPPAGAGAGSGAGQAVARTDVGCVATVTCVGRIATTGAGVGRIAATASAASAVLANQRLGLGAAVVVVVVALVLLVEWKGPRHPGAGSVSCSPCQTTQRSTAGVRGC